jgi:hypothetical protein
VIPRARVHRTVFIAAGIYNLAWGTWTIADPQWLFRFAGMPPANHPAIFACLGMVVGLYGVLYLDVARHPERGWLIVAVGLAGKVAGPAGMLWMIQTGSWPASTFVLCITNDLIWWVPFALFLRDAWPARQ